MRAFNGIFGRMLRSLVASFSLAALVACATGFQSDLENAKFALDQGDFSSAVTHASAAVSASPEDPVAVRILANAYFGRSGLDFLDLAEGLTSLQDSAEPNFELMASFLDVGSSMTDLRLAIETLETLDDVDATEFDDENYADAVFDLSIMQMIESFALGIFEANYFTTLDVSLIDDTDRANVLDSLLEFDNRMIASGVDSSEQFIGEVRQTFCILEPLSAGDGFTTSEYRTLVNCQLSTTASDLTDTTGIDAGIANCGVLNPDSQSAAVTACYNEDTAL